MRGVPAQDAFPWLWALVLAAGVIAAAYLQTLSYGFHFDDFSSIRDNPALNEPSDWNVLWQFRPSRFLLHFSFALNAALTGQDPAGFRAVNLLIHLASSLLVGAIAAELARCLRRADAPRSADETRRVATFTGVLGALLFAAHPLATQSVTYLIQRTTSLCGLFELGATYLFLQARKTQRVRLWAGSWALAGAAALTKEISVAVPFLIVLTEWALRWNAVSKSAPAVEPGPPSGRDRRVSLKWLVPYFAVVPVVAIVAQLPSVELGRAVVGLRETSDISRIEYSLTQLTVIPRYMALAVWPSHQNLDPDVPLKSAIDGDVLAGAALLAFVAAIALFFRRRAALASFGWLWFLVALLPESSLFPIRDVMNEHRVYVPLAGLTWAFASGLAWVASRRWGIAVALATACVLALAAVTYARNQVWRSETTLWSDVVSKSPNNPRAHNNLGMALEGEGRTAEAEQHFRQSIEIDPHYVYGLNNLGRLYGMSGRFEEARTVLVRAAELAPNSVDAWNNLGNVWVSLGDSARADAAYVRAIALDPEARQPRLGLARLRDGSHARGPDRSGTGID